MTRNDERMRNASDGRRDPGDSVLLQDKRRQSRSEQAQGSAGLEDGHRGEGLLILFFKKTPQLCTILFLFSVFTLYLCLRERWLA